MFYDKYAALCKQKSVSLTRAAIDAGISKSLISKWKQQGTQIPSPEVLQKLSVYFGVPVSDLLEEKIPATVSGSGTSFRYDELTEENRALVDDLIAKLLKSQSAD